MKVFYNKSLFKNSILSVILCCSVSCSTGKKLRVDFSAASAPSAPDYSNAFFWAALPDKKDSADHIPASAAGFLNDDQKTASVDVFYIHPTTYYGKENWNANFHDARVRKATITSLLNQASVFNGTCRIYAPEYRQVTYRAYFHEDDPDHDKAFALAYEDVKSSFQYYLDHYNNGRMIIIAAHSQGSTHALHLLQDYFDGKSLQQQLVAAYIVGIPVYITDLMHISPCTDSMETECFVTWRSYLTGYEKKETDTAVQNIIVTNPLSWSTENNMLIDASENQGGIGKDPDKIIDSLSSAQIHNGVLWVSKPDLPGKIFLFRKNYHIADYNLFWMNIRRNVALRTAQMNE